MAKFNAKSTSKTINRAGGEAFTQSPELAFISTLLTSFVKSQHYRTENDTIEDVKELFYKVDPLFAAKASVYVRNEFGMRSITHIVSSLIANKVKGEEWTKRYFNKVVYRPDDMTETLSYYAGQFGKPIPNSLKKGFAKAFEKFDEYQLAKYRAEGKKVSLVDVVNLVHPKASDALNKLIKGTLKSRNTWESKLSETKGDDDKKAKAWSGLIKERKLGYFALLRNLRNIFEQSPDVLDDALKMLTDEKLIRKSLVLPFRYTTAYKELQSINGTQKVLIALNQAIDISCKNVPELENTLIVLDTSGSMEGKPAEIGSLFSAIIAKSSPSSDFMTFSDDASYQTLNPMDSVITMANSINFRCGGTSFHSIFQTANKAYDRIIILSDMQGWMGYYSPVKTFSEYKNKYRCNPAIYSFDLAGYGDMQFPENGVYCLAGFSEKIFDIMKLLETDKNALIKTINNVEI
jgi:hypothetical protein